MLQLMKPSFLQKIAPLVPVAFIFLLCACSDALNSEYSKTTAEGDLERMQAIRRLDSADYAMLTDYMLRNGLITPDLKHINQSYKDLLELAREEKLKREKEAENARKIKGNKQQFVSDHMDHMHEALVMLPEKSQLRKDWSKDHAAKYTMVFVNLSDKPIRAFKGRFTFYDLFDSELKSIYLTFNDSIATKDTLRYIANIDFSHLVNNTIYVTNDYQDTKVVWQPMKILFKDGSSIE